MSEDKVFRKKVVFEEVKIPKGHVKCKACDGTGELRLYYGSPWDEGQFTTCWYCHGQGYVAKDWAEHLEKYPYIFPEWNKRKKETKP